MVHFRFFLVLSFVIGLISCSSNRNYNIKLPFPYLNNSEFIASNGSIVFCDTNYVIRNINAVSNDINWELNLEKRMEFLKIENIDKYLFIGGNYKNNYSYWLIEISDGRLISKNTFDFSIYHKPLFIENTLYFINSNSQIIKCDIYSSLYDVVNVKGIELGMPNNLVKYNDKFYTSHDGNLVEIDIETLEILNTIPLDIEFQGVLDHNFLLGDNIIIPGDKEIVIFNLDSNKIMKRHLAVDSFSNNLDYFCGITSNKDCFLTKSMAGLLKIYDSDNFNHSLILQTEEAPYLCENSIKITGNFILNSNYSNLELFDINTKEKSKAICEKVVSPFVQNGNIVLFINAENELCKIDINEID